MTAISNSRVLVTGAASGIGRGLCLALAARGAHVLGVDRDQAGLDSLAREIGDAFEGHLCDLSDVNDIERLGADLQDRGEPVDVLINNAGVVGGRYLEQSDPDSIERTFRVNALAPIHLTRVMLPSMLARDSGHIVTVASAAGIVGTARLVDYSASKWAAMGFDEALRLELKHRGSRIRTTVVCPFFVNTGMFDGVQTRWRWLLPILDPDRVIRRIVRAIERDRARLIMPWLVYTAWPARLLPVGLFDRLMSLLGITRSMDAFRGRSRSEQENTLKDADDNRGAGP
ncbi:SDR family oxidoreductase [Natronospira bacteriovora]|uniref:SDR family oxidoreductase n=1 Tax=Natronospira bacteriovora TaxID=3069753 RepID=A0ABU0W317_9GAMM|nr:SDR family oxidoreductase [Natronospira sp. AB-CW4]MDQ2068407.1 SDR family oxidoreductase [Natronospira sp. AB-CW4]